MGASRGEPLAWLRANLNYDSDECLIWPYARNGKGYACVEVDDVLRGAYRVMCAEAHGEPPAPDYEAAHNCGRGHEGCVAPNHLRWATPIENQNDKFVHGTDARGEQNPFAKLTEADIREIRALRGKMLQSEIADAYQISVSNVSRVQLRKSWAWLD